MDLGFSTLVGLAGKDFAETCAWAELHRFDCLEVNVGPSFGPAVPGQAFAGHLDLERIVGQGPAQVEALLRHHRLRIAALAPMLNLLDPDPAVRAARAAYFRLTLDACAVLRVPAAVTYGGSAFGLHFHGLPGVGDAHRSNRAAENLRHFEAVFGELAEYALARGVRIALETAPRGGGAGNVAHSPELWDEIFARVPLPSLGLSFDPSHLVWLGVGPVDAVVRRYAARIFHFDGKDCEVLEPVLRRQGILGPSWWRYRLPGMGRLDWASIVGTLRAVGYDGAVDIENEDPVHPGYAGVALAGEHLGAQGLRPGMAAGCADLPPPPARRGEGHSPPP